MVYLYGMERNTDLLTSRRVVHLLQVGVNLLTCATTEIQLYYYLYVVMGDISDFEFDMISMFLDISKLISILPLKYRYFEYGRYFDGLVN